MVGVVGGCFSQDIETQKSEPVEAPGLKGDERIWGLILHAHSDPERGGDPKLKSKPFHPEALNGVMEKVAKALPQYKHFNVLGAHDQKVLKEYTTWITPSPELFLEIDSKGRSKEGDGINIFLQLWKKHLEPGKLDEILVKSDATLKKGSPLIIEGPKWRKGRVVFVVVLEYAELLTEK